jgi:hypothetical protein
MQKVQYAKKCTFHVKKLTHEITVRWETGDILVDV